MFESIIKKYMTYILILLLIIYHSIQLLLPNSINRNLLSIIDIVELVLMIGFALISFKIPIVHKLLLGKDFIGGKYIGKSYYIDNKGQVIKDGKKMVFSIEQTLTKLYIDGFSEISEQQKGMNNLSERKETVWQGFFYKKDGDNYFFALEVNYGLLEVGILKLIFNKNMENKYIGYYYSGDSNSDNQKIIFWKETDKDS